MNVTSKWLRHWVGFFHGMAFTFCVAWTYEGKMEAMEAEGLAAIWIPVLILSGLALIGTVTAVLEEN